MFAELGHFFRHLPGTAMMSRRMGQAELYQTLMVRAEEHGLREVREALVADLRGEVLEIGCGTGLMFPYYGEGVAVTAIEPDERFRRLAEEAALRARARIAVREGRGEELPGDAGGFDAVVIALVLCSVKDPGALLGEVRRVLRPGGEVRLIEHVKSDGVVAGAMMTVFNPLWRVLNRQGCNMHRDTEKTLTRAGFELVEVRPHQFFSPGLPAFPMRWIRAVPRGTG